MLNEDLSDFQKFPETQFDEPPSPT